MSARSALAFLIALSLITISPTFAQTPRDPAKKTQPAEKDAKPPPIVFFIAKGEADACGPGCIEWIAADGTIDPGAAQRLRVLLERTKRKLPIYFHSPGGSVNEAIAIGRMLRARGMTAGVARTIPQGCDPKEERESACDALKRSKRDLAAELRTIRTLCNSSCVYALIGAKVREVTAGARIGVHATALAELKGGVIKLREGKLSQVETAQLQAINARLARYLTEMGIDRGLFEAAAAIKHERLRYISRDEIARFGIDRREFHESRWIGDEGPPLTVIKYATEARSGQYRTTLIRLICGRSKEIGVQFSRELGPSEGSPSIAIVARHADFVLPPSRRKPVIGYNEIAMEDRFTRVPLAFFEEAAKGEAIEIVEAPDSSASGASPRRTRLATLGLSSAIAALAQRCR